MSLKGWYNKVCWNGVTEKVLAVPKLSREISCKLTQVTLTVYSVSLDINC